MGRMKDLYISICEANGGSFPGISDAEAYEMNRLKIYNKEHYEAWKKKNNNKSVENESSKEEKTKKI